MEIRVLLSRKSFWKQILVLYRRIITGWAEEKCTITKSKLFSYVIYKLAL